MGTGKTTFALMIFCSIGSSILPGQTKEYIRINGRIVAIETVANPGPCQNAGSALSFFSSGRAGTAAAADGTVDANWKLVSNPSTYSGTNAIVFTPTFGGTSSLSKAINATGNTASVAPGAYVYRQKLDLSCHNPATVSITGIVNADDNVQVYVNGKPAVGTIGSWNSQVPFTINNASGAFIQGWNQVDFVVTNTGTSANPSQVRIEVGSATATPVPSASGAKFEVTANPAGGNRNGVSVVGLSSGSESVAWSFDGTQPGTLSGSTATGTTYTGPGNFTALTVVTVKATSTSPSAAVSLHPVWFNAGGTVSGTVTISGGVTTMTPFSTRAFNATVTGAPTGQSTVRWSVVSTPANSSSNGLISSGANCVNPMNYRAPSTIKTAGNIVLKAESCFSSAWSSTINIPVAVSSSVGVTLSPKPTSVVGSQAFTSSVTNADGTGVTWSVTPSGAGTISAAGLYTAAGGFSGNVTVRATSVENTNVSDTHIFNVPAAASITISSSGAMQSVLASGTANFPITYSSTGTTGQVTFSVLNFPAGANININPPSVTNQGSASVTASVSPGGVAAGTYNLTFRATNGTITKTLPLTLVVMNCGTITVSPSNVSVYPFQQANFTAFRSGLAASYGVTWEKNTSAGSFGSALNPPTVFDPQISYFAADPNTQPTSVTVTARSAAPGCLALTGSATVTKANYIPNGLSLLYTNPLGLTVPINLSRFFDYGAASQNGAGTVRFIQLEIRNNLGEIYDPATACAINFETTTFNNDPNGATMYAIAKVANNAAAGSSADNTAIPPRGGTASTQIVGSSSLFRCELDGTGSDYVRSTNIFALHMKIRLKSGSFTPGTMHVYVRSYGSDLYEPAIRQYMGSFTLSN